METRISESAAIVHNVGETTEVGDGCDVAVYMAAGYDKLHALRKEIGNVPEGEVFITPGFDLPAKYIIHAVSPLYIDGEHGEEVKLRSCYRKSLELAKEKGIQSISFPLIATGTFGYPNADGMAIAVDEINKFLLNNEMEVYLVVFGTSMTIMAKRIFPDLKAYIDHNYVCEKREEEYGDPHFESVAPENAGYDAYARAAKQIDRNRIAHAFHFSAAKSANYSEEMSEDEDFEDEDLDFFENNKEEMKKRLEHLQDSFGRYVIYLVDTKGMTPVEVQNRAWLSKKVYSKMKTNQDNYHHDRWNGKFIA